MLYYNPLGAHLVVSTSATLSLLWAHENYETLRGYQDQNRPMVTKIRTSSPKYAQMAFYLLWRGSRMLPVRSQVLMGEWVKCLLAFSFVLYHTIPSPIFKV